MVVTPITLNSRAGTLHDLDPELVIEENDHKGRRSKTNPRLRHRVEVSLIGFQNNANKASQGTKHLPAHPLTDAHLTSLFPEFYPKLKAISSFEHSYIDQQDRGTDGPNGAMPIFHELFFAQKHRHHWIRA